MKKIALLFLLLAPCSLLLAQNLGPVYEKASGGISITGIDAASLGDGSVSTTEFQYINTLSSNAQTQISGKVTSASSTANQIAYITGANTISGRTTFTDDGTTLTHRSASNGTGGNFRLSRADGNPVVQMGTYSSAFPGYGGYWGGNITPSGTNYAFISDGTSETIFNGVTLKFRISHANAMVVNSSSDVGVGIDAASARLHLLKTTEQLRIGYDASNYFSTTVGSSGIVTLNAVGSESSFKFSDPVLLQGYTVATLPTGVTGMHAYVTDATAPTYLGTLTGGGSVVCPVFYNGSAWVSH